MSELPDNVIRRYVLITDLSQQMKKQRDFLKWMARRYLKEGPERNQAQSEAFATGARLIEELRVELVDGLFDAPAEIQALRELKEVKSSFYDDEEIELSRKELLELSTEDFAKIRKAAYDKERITPSLTKKN